jgi:DNA polymerase III epsilon subunit family exonuclease
MHAWSPPPEYPTCAADMDRNPTDADDLLNLRTRPRATHAWVLDTETTGRQSTARIVEVAIVRVDLSTGETSQGRATLVHPGCPIPRDVIAVHGITDAMVRGAPTVDRVLPKLFDVLMKGAEANESLVIHNASFDLSIIRSDAKRVRVALPNRVRVYDSLRASRALRKVKGHSLSVVAERYGVAVEGAHRAWADVLMLAGVLPHLLREPAAESRCVTECFPMEGLL